VGDRAGGDVPPEQDSAHEDVVRIADAVREVVDAETTVISRVVDDEWLEVVAVAGTSSGPAQAGHRWPRSDLQRYLARAEHVGRLHVTTRREAAPASAHDASVLLAPLTSRRGELVGVLGAVGSVEAHTLAPEARDLVELYADQARLALDMLHEHHVHVEHLRLAEAAQTILYAAVAQPDVPELLDSLAEALSDMMRAGAVWVCAELGAGMHAEAASYPVEVAGRLDADLCALLDPLVEECWSGDTTLGDVDSPLLGRVAGVVGQERPLLAALGSGTGARGALLVLRGVDDEPWADHERTALASLGRRLGRVVEQLETRRRDQHLVD